MSTKRLNDLAIDLSANSLEGSLPHFPTNLTILNLSKNQFSGSISSLCKSNGFCWLTWTYPIIDYLKDFLIVLCNGQG